MNIENKIKETTEALENCARNINQLNAMIQQAYVEQNKLIGKLEALNELKSELETPKKSDKKVKE